MKMFLSLILLFICSAIFGQTVPPAEPVNIWHLIWAVVVPIIAGLWEVVVRIIPTVGNHSWIQKVIEILLWLSTKLNNQKKK